MTDIGFPQVWTRFMELIESHQRFLIASHIRPDGDAIGSALAMKRILTRLGKDAKLVLDEDIIGTFDRFYREGELEVYDPEKSDYSDREVLIMLDAGEWLRLGCVGAMMSKHSGQKVCVDHHIAQGDFDGLMIRDAKSPSTTVIVHRFIKFLEMEFDFELAEPIYLGIIVDTQNFHLPNTTEETHHIAADCLKAGVESHRVHEPIYGTTLFSRLRLMSAAFQTLEIRCNGIVGVMHTSQAMFKETEAVETDDDGFVDFVRTVEGVRIGIYIREENNGTVKVSWRAKGDNNIVISAQKFGGGGHIRAAGATITGSLEEAKKMVLDDLRNRAQNGEFT